MVERAEALNGRHENPGPDPLIEPRVIRYAVGDGVDLLGDLHLPTAGGPHPVLVGVPGGAWRYGSRKALAGWGDHLAQHGIALFSIDYRRATNGRTYPQAVQDVRAALRFVAAHGATWGCDPDRLGVLGASAGAHLASLAALSGQLFDHTDSADPAPALRAMILAYGVYDLMTHWQACRVENAAPGEDFTERFMGFAPFDDPWRYAEASPIRHVAYANNSTPVFLTWGTEDRAVLPAQSEAFALALQQARFTVRTRPLLGAGHYWFSEDRLDDPRGFTGLVAPSIVGFLDRHLRPLSAPERT